MWVRKDACQGFLLLLLHTTVYQFVNVLIPKTTYDKVVLNPTLLLVCESTSNLHPSLILFLHQGDMHCIQYIQSTTVVQGLSPNHVGSIYSVSAQIKCCSESLVVHDSYIINYSCFWGNNHCGHLEMERVFCSCIRGLKFIDTFWYTFLGKRKPWSGILLYGVRHLFYLSKYILFLLLFVVLIQSYQPCMFDL